MFHWFHGKFRTCALCLLVCALVVSISQRVPHNFENKRSLSTLYVEPGHNYNETIIDHSTGTHEESLFGLLIALDPIISTVAFLIIVGAVLLVDFIFHKLNYFAHDTSFENLVPAIEKEMMIAGCTAFMFKVVVNTIGNWDVQWFLSLEYADLVVPVFSFTYCFIGMLLIFISVRNCDMWSKAYHLKLLELLDDYFASVGTVSFL